MKRSAAIIMTVVLVFAMALAGCGGKSEESEESAEKEEAPVSTVTVVTNFTAEDIDPEGSPDLPLQLEKVTLYDDGSVSIVPADEVKKIAETNNEIRDGATHPFEELGKVKEIYLVRFGNGGYRTLIALMEDGSLSALSAKDLIEDHIIVVRPNVGNRDDFVSVKQIQDEDAFGVVGVTKDGDEIELDYSLDF